jgi:hypothetical protein
VGNLGRGPFLVESVMKDKHGRELAPEILQEMLNVGVVVLRAHDWDREHIPELANPPEKAVMEIFMAMMRVWEFT